MLKRKYEVISSTHLTKQNKGKRLKSKATEIVRIWYNLAKAVHKVGDSMKF